jgi:hypothetical protein
LGPPETRRTAFWFAMFGPLFMLAGQVAVHAAAIGDSSLYRLVGLYLKDVRQHGFQPYVRFAVSEEGVWRERHGEAGLPSHALV